MSLLLLTNFCIPFSITETAKEKHLCYLNVKQKQLKMNETIQKESDFAFKLLASVALN